MAKHIPNVLRNVATLETHYPQAIEFNNQQLKVFWLPDEIKLEKDIQDILVNMTPSEKHGVITTLKLFTLYELKAGSEYWGGRFKNLFTRHEFQRMASTFAMTELAIHKPFYSKINELLHLDTDEFYNSYVDDPVLKARIEFIDSIVDDEDDLVSLGGFSLVEGVILYGNFGYLKHFQAQGKNKLLNMVRGINFSVRDENIHSMAGAWAFKTLKSESMLTEDQLITLESKIRKCAIMLCEHEHRIIDMIFEKGPIDGITPKQLKHFAESRVNEVLHNLGYKKEYEVTYNPIAQWFYKAINDFVFNDTFSGVGNQYHRNWDESAFVWEEYKKV